jgi:hypothetical protein
MSHQQLIKDKEYNKVNQNYRHKIFLIRLLLFESMIVMTGVVDPDPHQSDKLHPDPDPHQFPDNKSKCTIWDMSLFEYCFKVLSLYLEARLRIRIRIKVKGRIRISIKVTSRVRIRIRSATLPEICQIAIHLDEKRSKA